MYIESALIEKLIRRPIRMIVVLLFFCFHSIANAKSDIPVGPWSPDSSKKELISLLGERKILFDAYTISLSHKSGFFGNKTKNDLRESQDKLEAIITQDNKIMKALYRTLDFRNFEKLNMRYDASAFEDRIFNLKAMNDTLNKHVIILEKQYKESSSAIRKYTLYFISLIVLLIFTTVAWLRQKFR